MVLMPQNSALSVFYLVTQFFNYSEITLPLPLKARDTLLLIALPLKSFPFMRLNIKKSGKHCFKRHDFFVLSLIPLIAILDLNASPS